jgi:hypothetical protein
MNIYVARDGQTYGPYTSDHAHQMIGLGQLQINDLACPEGAADWHPLGQVLGLPPVQAAPQPQAQAYAPQLSVARPAIPIAQPASAVTPPGYAPRTTHVAGTATGHMAGGAAPNSAVAQMAVRQLHKKVSSAFTTKGLSAALAVICAGLPILGMVAESSGATSGLGGIFGSLGLMWGAAVGIPLAGLCFWWFTGQKKKAEDLKNQFLAARMG